MAFFDFLKRPPKPKLIVTREDKLWVESNLEWMMQQYGLRPLLLPPVQITKGAFAHHHERVSKAMGYYLEQVCHRMDINPDEVALKRYTAGDNSGFDGPVHVSFEGGYSNGEYHHRNNLTGKFDIHINEVLADDLEALLATMAHELGHVKLLGEYRIAGDDDHHEYLTDLTAIYFGFGIQMANSCHTRNTWTDNKGYSGWSIGKSGYLPLEVRVYALAVQAYLQGRKDPEWKNALGKVPQKRFQEALLWLHETGDCDARLPQSSGGRAGDI